MTQPGVPLFDPANPPSGKVAARLDIGKLPTPDGELGVATIRLASGVTLPVLLNRAEAGTWADTFAALRDSLSGAGLVIPAPGQSAQLLQAPRNGQR